VGVGFAGACGVGGPKRHLLAVVGGVVVAFDVLAVLVLVWNLVLGVFHECGEIFHRRSLDGWLFVPKKFDAGFRWGGFWQLNLLFCLWNQPQPALNPMQMQKQKSNPLHFAREEEGQGRHTTSSNK
jgi:hypothetical protein